MPNPFKVVQRSGFIRPMNPETSGQKILDYPGKARCLFAEYKSRLYFCQEKFLTEKFLTAVFFALPSLLSIVCHVFEQQLCAFAPPREEMCFKPSRDSGIRR